MKTNVKTRLARVLCAILTVCLLVAFAVPAFATEANKAITDAKNAVVQIQIWYVDPEMADNVYLGYGTGFLINEDTVVTCQHVISGFSDEWYAERAIATSEYLGRERTAKEIKENLELRVSVLRDVHVKATIRKSSTEMDYAILTLEERLNNRTILPLRSSSDLKQTEAVYALGFPGDLDEIADQNYYDADDVTITSGSVNKVDRFSFWTTDGSEYNNVDCVESSALLAPGNSGGPLVDATGAVVGINAVGSDTRNLSVASDQLIAALDALGISYTEAGSVEDPTEELTEAPAEDIEEDIDEEDVEEEDVDEEDVEEEDVDEEDSRDKDSDDKDSDDEDSDDEDSDEEDSDEEEEFEIDPMIIILAVVAVAVIAVIVVVVVVVSNGKNKKKPVSAGRGYIPPAPPAASTGTGFTAAPATPVAAAPMRAGETTVLSQDAGETTVLSRNVNGGTLIRKRSGEKITISNEKFVIGRDRKSVNYCISNNSSISRNHVTLEVRGEVTYLVDMNAANGTFVNGIKAMPRQEIELKNGDTITLSDEDFEYKK